MLEETEPGLATTYPQASTSEAASDNSQNKQTTTSTFSQRLHNYGHGLISSFRSGTHKPSSLDSTYAPPTFRGHSSEDATEFMSYLERFMDYKQLGDCERIDFVGILLRDAAGYFFENLPESDKTSWKAFKDAFLARFGRCEATKWRDAREIWGSPQGLDEQASDFIARIIRISKRVPDIDESTLRYAILNGLRPAVRTHVLQADVKTLDELINAARVADAAVSTSDPAMSALLEEVRTSNAQHAKHNAAFQELSSRLDKLQVTSVHTDSNYTRRQVHFDDQPPRSRSPSPRRYPRQFQQQQRSNNYSQGQRTWAGNEGMNTRNNFAPRQPCYRCGRQHFGSCPAQHAACLLCGKTGHFRVVCRSGRRTNNDK